MNSYVCIAQIVRLSNMSDSVQQKMCKESYMFYIWTMYIIYTLKHTQLHIYIKYIFGHSLTTLGYKLLFSHSATQPQVWNKIQFMVKTFFHVFLLDLNIIWLQIEGRSHQHQQLTGISCPTVKTTFPRLHICTLTIWIICYIATKQT